MLFIDAYAVSRSDDFMGAFALGMMGVVAVIALSLPYAAVMDSPGVSYLFWYAAGLVAAERVRRAIRAPEAPRMAQPLAVRVAGAR
jgi:arginine exporter protein ArgO